ncbi:MAG: hypothetical protein CL431_01450 [Acidimicrobiaceae bacterium]|jgi:hypothetical protein|nr:hypothetical protein [Acidimicrobiaceae bacterium]|tara:strand:- start:64037 stop:64483 length:447 start_codon:yes stop_codon:yes gene_type:complete
MRKFICATLLLLHLPAGCTQETPTDPLAFCANFIEVAQPNAPLNNYGFNNIESVEKAIQDLQKLMKEPPDEIAESAEKVVNLYIEILDALLASSPDNRPTVLLEFQNKINDSIGSIEDFEDYGESVCGIDFETESQFPTTEIPLDLNN